MDDYISVKQAATKWSASPETVRRWCRAGLVPGAISEQRAYNPGWLIPVECTRPMVGPVKACKRGHPFTVENTWVSKDGKGRRYCRACGRLRDSKRVVVEPVDG